MTKKMTEKMTKKMTKKMTEKIGKISWKSDNTFIGPVEGFFDVFWGHFLAQKVRTKFHRRVKKKNFANFKKMLLTWAKICPN
jgi:hypothetical protein